MRKKLVIAGAVLIVMGLVTFFITSSTIDSHSYVSSQMSARGSAEWVSQEINSTSSTDIDVTMPANTTIGLVHAGDLGSVSRSSLSEYAVAPQVTGNSSANYIHVYLNDTGNYYIVAFASSQPSLHYTVISDAGYVSIMTFANFIGIMITAAGLVATVIGVLLRKKGGPDSSRNK